MALKGTLKDFGIAEILQLIGQQAKRGVLHLESRDEAIHITMADGNVVRAESAGRKAREKLGTLLVPTLFAVFVIVLWRGLVPPPQPSPYVLLGKLIFAGPIAVGLWVYAVRDAFRRTE